MHKMLRHMVKYGWALALIIALLAAQAVCDLTLPSYTARIVDVGIQQKGVEHSAPIVLREQTLKELTKWMYRADAEEIVMPAYTPATDEEAAALGVTVKGESLYKLEKVDEEQQQKLDAIFSKAFMIFGVISGQSDIDMGALVAASGEGTADGMPQMTPDAAVAMLGSMSDDEREAMLDGINEKLFSILPDSALTQAAISAVAQEYTALGIDMGSMQSRSIWRNGGLMLLVTFLGALATVAVNYMGSLVSAGLGRDLRGKVFHKVVSFSQQEMEGFSTASLITRSTNDIQQVQTVMVMLLRMVIYAPIIGVGGVIRAWRTNQSMAWIIFLGVLLVLSVVLVFMSVGMPRFKRMQTQIDKVNRVMRETLSGLPVIRAFVTQRREEERFDEASGSLMKTQLFVGRLMSGMMPLMMLIMNGIAILIMWNGAQGINAGNMQVGDMMAYIQYTMQVIMAFLMISMMSVMLPRASVSAARIQEVLDKENSIAEPETPVAFDAGKRGTVEFDNVSFRYPGAENDMLRNISFTANAGQTTAILGGTGSGKSTLINLIPRFYDTTGGTVRVDGVDVRQAGLIELRDRIGYVPQKSVLFSGSIKENISFGSEGMEDSRIEAAARVAQAEQFVSEREEGYDSLLAQGGANVSGGQKQRLSIARAVAKAPEIYIFDDSFSALDFKTDAAVRSALKQASADSTVIVVAQRISTVMHAEQILVLDEGELVGKGTHEELMRSCEVYRQIAMSQLSKEELGDGKEA